MPLTGSTLSPLLALPFIGMLLSIALIPPVAPGFWARHYGKVALAWSVIALAMIAAVQGLGAGLHSFAAVMVEQFIPFIMVLLALFTITGGIKIHGTPGGTPLLNTLLLFAGTLAANLFGTAGASVLLVRPLLSANAGRKTKLHTLIFFIFLVGNIGGSLTPIGNPPLLMGFICKVGFFWPFTRLFVPTAFAAAMLLIVYYITDSIIYRKETGRPPGPGNVPFRLEGAFNAALLIVVVVAVLLSGKDLGTAGTVAGTALPNSELLEIVLLATTAFLSWKLTGKETRTANKFTWHPILEVGKLFAGIFITMTPLIAMLNAGRNGPMAFIMNSLTAPDGHPLNGVYFWFSGILSGFLDSAPAYLLFFQTAAAGHGDAVSAARFMMNENAATLAAISLGASFMGALSYIGNAPNMMIKAIAEENGIAMPSFFGYMVWSFGFLIPLFFVVQFLFIK